jgi:hypothetical protein
MLYKTFYVIHLFINKQPASLFSVLILESSHWAKYSAVDIWISYEKTRLSAIFVLLIRHFRWLHLSMTRPHISERRELGWRETLFVTETDYWLHYL